MKKIITTTMLICFCLFTAHQAAALDLGIEGNRGKHVERNKSLSTKNSTEKKESKGNKTSATTTKGSDQQALDVIRQVGRQMQDSKLDITLSLGDIFMASMGMLENNNNIPSLHARIITSPRKPASFGLTAEIQPGVIDSIKADLLNKMASSDAMIRQIGNEDKIKKYRDNIALYGIIIAQAYLNLNADLSALEPAMNKDKSGHIVVQKIGYDDFQTLADGALYRAVKHIGNKRLQKIYNTIIADQRPCQFAGTITTIQCGSSVVNLSIPPVLNALGMTIFSPDRYMGFSGQYRVSSNWSYDQALEAMKSTSKYKKMAEEVSQYADKMESKGQGKEAVRVKKLAWDSAKSGKVSLALARLIPGF